MQTEGFPSVFSFIENMLYNMKSIFIKALFLNFVAFVDDN